MRRSTVTCTTTKQMMQHNNNNNNNNNIFMLKSMDQEFFREKKGPKWRKQLTVKFTIVRP
jgi:hypothetical protein